MQDLGAELREHVCPSFIWQTLCLGCGMLWFLGGCLGV